MKFFKKKILKSKIILGLPIAFFYGEACLAAFFGYFLAKFFSGKKEGEKGKIKSLVFEIKNWKIHLHHWLICLAILSFGLFFGFLPFQRISSAFLLGAIIQGMEYSDWHQVVKKKNKQEKNGERKIKTNFFSDRAGMAF